MELIAERPGVKSNVRRGETGQAGDAPFILEGLAAELGDFELDTMKLRLAKNSHAGGLDDGVDELLDTGFVIEDAAFGLAAEDLQMLGHLGLLLLLFTSLRRHLGFWFLESVNLLLFDIYRK